MQDHRKLDVWKKAHALAIDVRRGTRNFPLVATDPYSRRWCARPESVVFNIIEGCGSRSQREFARFLDIGIKSTMELEGELELAKDYGVLDRREWEALTGEAVRVRRMLCGLRAKVLSKPVVTG
ncbi:MAG: four helix bundle protein [Gemmatimonadota bacterium]|nr:four helix bundle protein [Gemmatimonadota bacterium]